MPTYDYECSACTHRFEVFEGVHEAGVKKCPQCGKKKTKRLMGTGAGIIFKGSGFYTTDYKNPPSKAEPSSGAKPPEPKPPGVTKKTTSRSKKEKD